MGEKLKFVFGGTRPRLVLQCVDFQCFTKWGVELWQKNGCDSTLGIKWYLIINEL